MRRALFFFCVIGLCVSPTVLFAEETLQLPDPPNPIQQRTSSNLTLNLITVKTTVDKATGDYEIALIGRVVLAEALPETGSLVIDATIREAGTKGTYGLWFFNPKLQRLCARQERKETIGYDQLIPLSEGHVYDFLWSGKVAPHNKPVIDLSVSKADGSDMVQISTSVDPSSGGEWFVSGQRYANGAQQITLPVPPFEANSEFVQFISYGCLKAPFPEGKLTSGEEVMNISIEDGGNPFGCKWWVTKPVRVGEGNWTFRPPELQGLSTQLISFSVPPNMEPRPDPSLSAQRL